MADIEEVTATLASTITGIINAAGPTPVPLTVAPGWPTSDDLNALLRAGSAHISVYAQPGVTSNVTRWQWDWNVSSTPTLTFTAVAGNTITFGGNVSLPLNVAVTATDKRYTYAPVVSDTPTSIKREYRSLRKL